MRWRPAAVAALVIWGADLLFVGAALWLLFLNRSTWVPLILLTDAVGPAVIGLTYTAVGAFLFSRFPRNALTWVLWGSGLLFSFLLFSNEYVVHALVVAPGSLAAAPIFLWLSGSAVLLAQPVAVLLLVLLFPDGRPPTRAWGILLVISLVISALALITGLVLPTYTDRSPGRGVPLHVDWPGYLAQLLAFRATTGGRILGFLKGLAFVGVELSFAAAVIARVWRTWHVRGVERQQLKWLAYVLAGMVVGIVGIQISTALGDTGLSYSSPHLSVAYASLATVDGLEAFGIPAAILIAVTKYRLYDIDLIINKTLVYGFLAVVITVVYMLLVVGVGAMVGGPERFGLSLVATALIALGFQPLRERAQRFANRIVYGKRATPYEALSKLNEQIAAAYGGEEILDRMTRILAEATGAERAELWVKTGQDLVRTSAWPAAPATTRAMNDGNLPAIVANKVLPVTHKGQLLGALAVTKKRGEGLTPVEDKLLTDLASQAGLVLENAGLNRELLARLNELQSSRQRLVRAQDEERRRIERNIHDGAQQELVALTVQLGLLERTLAKEPEKAKAMAAGLREDAMAAVETLRELAHGIYPPLLVSDGLASALGQQTRRSPVPIELDARDVPRQPKEVEAAVYFCCLEALQNIAKHAHASTVRIRLWADDAQLRFEVEDNGRGFAPTLGAESSGLQNMRDRMQALGGSLDVQSNPGKGTIVRGAAPLRLVPVTAS